MLRKLLPAVFAVGLGACATGYKSPHIYYELQVVNNSDQVLGDVRVTLTGIGRSFECGDVAALGICFNRFGKRRYDYQPVRVEWTAGSGDRRNDEFVIDVPATFSSGAALRAVLAVSESGEMSAYFEQDSLRR